MSVTRLRGLAVCDPTLASDFVRNDSRSELYTSICRVPLVKLWFELFQVTAPAIHVRFRGKRASAAAPARTVDGSNNTDGNLESSVSESLLR